MQCEWSNDGFSSDWYLGQNRNEVGECTNCNGASVGYGIVQIVCYGGGRKVTCPYIMLNQFKLVIYNNDRDTFVLPQEN